MTTAENNTVPSDFMLKAIYVFLKGSNIIDVRKIQDKNM